MRSPASSFATPCQLECRWRALQLQRVKRGWWLPSPAYSLVATCRLERRRPLYTLRAAAGLCAAPQLATQRRVGSSAAGRALYTRRAAALAYLVRIPAASLATPQLASLYAALARVPAAYSTATARKARVVTAQSCPRPCRAASARAPVVRSTLYTRTTDSRACLMCSPVTSLATPHCLECRRHLLQLQRVERGQWLRSLV